MVKKHPTDGCGVDGVTGCMPGKQGQSLSFAVIRCAARCQLHPQKVLLPHSVEARDCWQRAGAPTVQRPQVLCPHVPCVEVFMCRSERSDGLLEQFVALEDLDQVPAVAQQFPGLL
ncbi:hypothetical protein CSUI_000522 [Cystoisospora suis]|uniref:Uncharacterized protein n=1 Tax=Cystoisospora suis TaxID=483139 RepID=A0A2C6LBZ2_9APIC|nr:hypothetical protein CSUI_000522 [Cystoisospora suis]